MNAVTFFVNNITKIFHRPTAILFSIENVKVVVKHDEVIIFGPTIPQVKEFIPALQQQIQNSISSSDFSAANSTSESSDAYNIPSSRFEHVVLETALNVVCNNLFTQVRRLSPAVGKRNSNSIPIFSIFSLELSAF